MTGFTGRSIHWLLRRLAARPRQADDRMPGVETILDGATAVAAAEASWCDTAGIAATFPASTACRAWQRMSRAAHRNAFDVPIESIDAESAAGALAAAIGAASAGRRTTAFLSGQDLAAASPLLAHAAGRHVPFVAHVATSALPARSISLAGCHQTWTAASDSGWGQLIAANAQEAVDLALAARIASERALLPIMIGIDGIETGAGAQDVHLPEPALVRELLPEPGRRIRPATPAQRIVLGEHRRQTPRWHDLDHPMMTGQAVPGPESTAGAAADRPYFTDHAAPIIAEALAAVSLRTGRPLTPTLTHHTNDADLLLVTTGSITETARRLVDELRSRDRLRVGLLAIRQLRPWPADEITETLRRAKTIITLERADSPLASDAPLARELRATLSRAGLNPSLCQALHALAGPCATTNDLAELCRQLTTAPRSPVYVGVDHTPPRPPSPRKQAVLDRAQRDQPDLEKHRIRAKDPSIPPTPDDAHSITLIRRSGSGDEPLSLSAAALLHTAIPGTLRSLPGVTPIQTGALCIDRIVAGATPVTPDHDAPADIVIVTSTQLPPDTSPTRLVKNNGTLIIPRPTDTESTTPIPLQQADLTDARARSIRIIAAPFDPPKQYERPEPTWRRHEALLGALVKALADIPDVKPLTPKKASEARRSLLEQEAPSNVPDRLDAFNAALDRCHALDPSSIEPRRPAEPAPETPELLRRLTTSNQPLSDLPEFAGRAAANDTPVAADPFLAIPTLPALSAALRPVADQSGLLPEFDPTTCTGIGAAWTSCPDGSISAVAVGPAAILETGIALATEAGAAADALTPLISKLAPQINKRALAADRPPTAAREACEDAYAWLIEKMAPPDDRRRTLDDAFRAVMDAIGMLPIARTRPFFDEPEEQTKGAGEFLVIGVNPDACKDAPAAVGPCEGHGLRIVERTPANLERARLLWRIFERLPDTSGQTIERVADHEAVGPLAALMLAKSCAHALAPGDASEIGSGPRMALRCVLAAAEAEMQPRVQRLLTEIADLRTRLSRKVHDALAQAVPDADLDALAEGLHALGREDVDLSDLSASVSQAATQQRIDAVGLARIVEAARTLADLEWKLQRGASGLGRARAGVAISAGAATLWAVASPLNPFPGPVTVDATGFSPELARGLCEGQMSAAVEAARTLRWARAELDRPAEAPREPDRLRSLTWADLSDDERALCPPLLLIGDDESLATAALGSLLWLLASPLPVKAVILTGAGALADDAPTVDAFGPFPPGARADAALLALLSRNTYVARTSIAAGDHLAVSVQRALAYDGPALLHIHAPSPTHHAFPPHLTLHQADLAVRARAHCLFRFNPDAGGVFGSCLDLTENPDPLETFSKLDNRTLTPLDWAVTEGRFHDQFRPPTTDDTPVPAHEFLALPPEERTGKVARVTNPLDHTDQIASDPLVAFADDRLRLWRTLQELGGLVTPFTQRVREDAQRAVADQHKAELDALRREYEAKLQTARAEFDQSAVHRVREGLMRLAGYAPADQSQRENGDQ